MEQQLKEAVGGERKMSELIAFLLQGRSSVCLLVVVKVFLTYFLLGRPLRSGRAAPTWRSLPS